MNRVWLVIALGAALGASCSEPASQAPPQLNLDRPIDIAFACYGEMIVNGDASATPIMTAQPATSCETRSPTLTTDPQTPPAGQEGLTTIPSWYGFILQSAAGTVAIARWSSKPADQFVGGDVAVIDADPLTPGKNAISVGEDPIAIATDKAGCFEITANAGSCDLSELDINSALDDDPAVRVTRVAVKNAMGETIRAKPAAMVAEPNTEVVGKVCAATASGVVYIAYPSCHLVAGVDASTGEILSGIQYDADGVPSILKDAALASVSCPAECPDANGTLGTITRGTRPVTLALELALEPSPEPDPRVQTKRLVIGADNSASATIVKLGVEPDDHSPPLSLSQIALSNPTGKLGITSIALSPQLGVGGSGGVINDDAANQAQYVYAVATDNTVRVADVFNLNRECDTQIDSRFLRTVRDVATLQCLPVGDPALPRRVGARGPGIEVAGVPTSVAFFKAPTLPPPPSGTDPPGPGPMTLLGYFAIITASNGASFVVNVDDDNNPINTDLFVSSMPQATAPTLTIAHQLRDNGVDRGRSPMMASPADPNASVPSCLDFGPGLGAGGASVGGPRSTTPPARNVVGGPVADNKVSELPGLRQVQCIAADAPAGIPVSEVQFSADLQTRDREYPDLRSLGNEETWTMTWEGLLSQDTATTAIDGPQVREAVMVVDNAGMRLEDQAQPFCAMGVEPFDIVQFRGCNPANGDGDCPSGYQCYLHPDSQVATGACMLRTEASRLATACRDFLISRRRYTVGLAPKSGALMLLPRKHVLRTTPIDGCTTDAQCEALADYAAKNPSSADPAHDPTLPDPHTWACRADDARAPVVTADPAQNKRCVETCLQDSDCDVGTICRGAVVTDTVRTPGVCMEGVTPPQSCVNGRQRFDVRASEAFTVIGSRVGYVHPIVSGPNGVCEAAPSVPPLTLGRIPLQAPACGDPATTDPITGQLAGGGFEANPCSLTVPQFENQPVYTDPANGNCAPGTPPFVAATRNAPAIQFRNPGLKLTIVDPTYPGDQTCVLDRQGALGRIPLVFPGYQVSFHQTAGYSPLILPIDPAFPVKVVHGPTNSIWVIDDGDFLSASVTQLPTHGRVFRVESTSLQTVNRLE